LSNVVALVAATTILVLIPGPNVALIVANSISGGFRAGAVTVLGTTLGVALQLVLVVLGLAAIIQMTANALTLVRWAGVTYLLILGIRTWCAPAKDMSNSREPRVFFFRGCLIATLNPKTLLFSAAFLPQFISPTRAGTDSLALIATVFLGVLFLGDMLWVLMADFAKKLVHQNPVAEKRVAGGAIFTAGVGLALNR